MCACCSQKEKYICRIYSRKTYLIFGCCRMFHLCKLLDTRLISDSLCQLDDSTEKKYVCENILIVK